MFRCRRLSFSMRPPGSATPLQLDPGRGHPTNGRRRPKRPMLPRFARAGVAVALAVLALLFSVAAEGVAQGGVDGPAPVVHAKPPVTHPAAGGEDISPQIRVQSTLVTTPVTV